MDALELRNDLVQMIMSGLKKSVEDRKNTNSGPHYAELTGRIDAMRTLLDYLVNVDTTPTPCGVCAKRFGRVGQTQKNPGPLVDDSNIEEGTPI